MVVEQWLDMDSGRGEQQHSTDFTTEAFALKDCPSNNHSSIRKKNSSILQFASLAREFLQTPAGESSIGPEGYLPTAVNKDRESRQTALGTLLVALHLLREEQKLDMRMSEASDSQIGQLAPLLAQLGHWLGWSDWNWKGDSYYGVELGDTAPWLSYAHGTLKKELYLPP